MQGRILQWTLMAMILISSAALFSVAQSNESGEGASDADLRERIERAREAAEVEKRGGEETRDAGDKEGNEAPADDHAEAPRRSTGPSSEDVMRGLLDEREAPPVTEPTPKREARPVRGSVGLPAGRSRIDPDILGIAPGQEQPKLRREGEFVVSRRGRLVHAGEGAYAVFVFEADSENSPEPPMILQPCRLLEDMEDYVDEHGDSVVFVLTGQVHVYRNRNYILPTMMKIAVDKGNLKP
ncbi:MAG: hypothetical protein MI741_12230 [Rhodospirillales bacterium]|nr:hypothetical protein [Rhodospirillales bacterium]